MLAFARSLRTTVFTPFGKYVFENQAAGEKLAFTEDIGIRYPRETSPDGKEVHRRTGPYGPGYRQAL